MAADIKELVHPLIVRLTHWINVVAVLLMIASGWRIYNADPIFDFSFPDELTLGGWLAGALQWHFAAMWLLALNGLVYVCYGIIAGHFFAMVAVLLIVIVHVIMVILVPRTFPSMFTGRIRRAS